MARVNLASVAIDPIDFVRPHTPLGSTRKPAASLKIEKLGGYWTAVVPTGQPLMSFASIEACLSFVEGFIAEVVS